MNLSEAIPPTLDGDELTQVVLAILLERHPALVDFAELTVELPQGSGRDIPESVIHDAIDELVRLGLAHRLDRFIFASYTAVRAKQLC